jgi:pimeloyl-ACP methyl ester carboxylesterase
MPLNLAFFDANAAADVIAAFPQIQKWAVAGHSLGGVAASGYAASNPDKIEGVGFWAAYPQGGMTMYPGQVVSISASNDGLATREKIEASKQDLPPATTYVVIQGGNHAQFGYYGAQEGDNPAAISRAEQQKQLVAAMIELLQGL